MLVGPTAVGKTAVAVRLAEHWPGLTVISADARQVYRGLDIGTAKASAAVQAQLPHRGIDLVDPGERYSAGQFARDAAQWLAQMGDRPVIVVGGTGFYVRALADGLFREPAMPPASRTAMRGWLNRVESIARWAARLDPASQGGGRQRAQRAVEVALITGRPLSWWQEHARAEGVVAPWYIRLTLPRAVLHKRIAERVHAMLEGGFVAEVERVLAAGVGVAADAPGLDGVGYREVVRHLAGELSAAALPDAIQQATRRYAKRQETWFRHQLTGDVLTLDATGTPEALAATIAARFPRGAS